MSAKLIARLLKQALLEEGKMERALYEDALEGLLDELIQSMVEDEDDYIFAVTENNGDVAMVLAEKSGAVHINEQVRKRLQFLWPAAYESNMRRLIPVFAKQLNQGEIPLNGVKQLDL